jgi:integral membrane sensor domain MASE1
MMTRARSLARTVAFAALYLVATFAGRLTVMDETNLSMVWPAAGVALVWFWAQRHATTRWVDVLALATITAVSNMATGASGVVALIFVVANVIQVGVVMRLIARWRPRLLGAGEDVGLRGPRDLWGLLGAALAAVACGAAIGSTGMWLATGHFSWSSTAVWLSRNLASMLLIGAIGLRIGYEINKHRARHGSLAGWWRRAASQLADTPRWRVGEYLALTACSILVYVVGFAYNNGLPLAFPLIVVTVWAALRLTTTFVVAHDLGVSVIAVLFTLHHVGPFADIPSNAARALVAQVFVTIVAVVGLALALGRDERDRLMGELDVEKERASRRADLLSTIIDSMTDGLVVVESSGHVVHRGRVAQQSRVAMWCCATLPRCTCSAVVLNSLISRTACATPTEPRSTATSCPSHGPWPATPPRVWTCWSAIPGFRTSAS